jgi:hypothetical protein
VSTRSKISFFGGLSGDIEVVEANTERVTILRFGPQSWSGGTVPQRLVSRERLALSVAPPVVLHADSGQGA